MRCKKGEERKKNEQKQEIGVQNQEIGTKDNGKGERKQNIHRKKKRYRIADRMRKG